MAKNTAFAREGYLRENYHYFHLRDTAGQERDFHFHEFDKIVLLLSGRVDYFVESEIYALEPWSLLLVSTMITLWLDYRFRNIPTPPQTLRDINAQVLEEIQDRVNEFKSYIKKDNDF